MSPWHLGAVGQKAFRSERAVNDAFDLVIEMRKVGSYKRRDSSSNGA